MVSLISRNYYKLFYICTAGICLFVASELSAEDRAIATGKHFQIVVNFNNKVIAKDALETAEAVWPFAADLYGAKTDGGLEPLRIHLFRNAEDYRKQADAVAGGRFQRNLAFSSRESRSAYIAIQPPCSDETLAIIGLPILTRHQIAHEAAHLACYALVRNERCHPDWLSEGAATWIAEQAMTRRGWCPGIEADPYMSTDVWRVQNLLANGTLPSVRRILRDDYGELGFYRRYAVQRLFFRFMATDEDAEAFEGIMSASRRIGCGSQYTEKLSARVVESLGNGGAEHVDKRFRAYVRSLVPQWRESYRSLETGGDAWAQIAFENQDAVAWRVRGVGRNAYRLVGSVQILPNRARRTNLLLGRDDNGFICVAFVAGYGVRVFRFHTASDDWETLAATREPVMKVGKAVAFEVVVRQGRLKILVESRVVCDVSLGDKGMTGPWGLGAAAGAAGIWHGLELHHVKR